MTGFYDLSSETPDTRVPEVEWPPVTPGRIEIDAIVQKAQRERSEAIGSWIRHIVEEWASLLRRPGRAVPNTFRNPNMNA
jgi:hypothetical protein